MRELFSVLCFAVYCAWLESVAGARATSSHGSARSSVEDIPSPPAETRADTKRKRDSDDLGDGAEATAVQHTVTMSEIADSDFAVMIVRLSNRRQPNLSKAGAAADWGPICEDLGPLEVESLLPRYGHRVQPASQWDAMKNYKQFVVRDNQFSVGDYVYINNREFEEAESHSNDWLLWVARVLEIRARNSDSVRLRVAYLYWPDELPSGRLPYHGQREMIMSNHMDILDAQCVHDKADVSYLSEEAQIQEDSPTLDGIYWRQTYDVTNERLSTAGLRRDCICRQPHNPEKLLIQCRDESCGLWNHEWCLEVEALRNQWAKIVNNAASFQDEASDESIEVSVINSSGGATLSAALSTVTPRLTESNPRKKLKVSRCRKSRGALTEQPWEGHLQAQVERKKSSTGAATLGITGRVNIQVLHDASQVVTNELKCLKCNTVFL